MLHAIAQSVSTGGGLQRTTPVSKLEDWLADFCPTKVRDALSAASAAVMSMVQSPAADPMLPIRDFYEIMRDIIREVDAAMDDLANRPYRDMKAVDSVQALRHEKFRLIVKIDELQRQLRSWEERQPMILQYMRALEPLIRELRKARDILLGHGYDVSSIDAALQSMKDKTRNRTTQNATADRSSPKRIRLASSSTLGYTPVNIQASTPYSRGASRDLMPPPRLPLQQRQHSNTAGQYIPTRDHVPTQPYDIPHHRGTISPSFIPSPQSHHSRPYAYAPPHDISPLIPSPTSQPYLRTSPSSGPPIAVHRRFERPDPEPMRASTYFPSQPEPSRYQSTNANRLHRAIEPEAEPPHYIPTHLARQPLGPPQENEHPDLVWIREYLAKNPIQYRSVVDDGELDQSAPRTRLPPPVTPRRTASGFRSHIHTSSSSVTSPFFGREGVTPGFYGGNTVSGRRVQR